MSADAVTPGVYGKLPSRGDFFRRNLSADFVEHWDSWLQEALTVSRQQLGQDWLRCYLNGPVWRFVLSAGNCGDVPVAGVLMPSIDRVGRYFPLTLALPLPRDCDLPALLGAGREWFDRAEHLVLEVLSDELDPDALLERIQSLPALDQPKGAADFLPGGQRWQCPLSEQLEIDLPSLLPALLAQAFPRYTLWWSQGGLQVQPSLLINSGLPPAASFAAMLAGDWARWDWTVVNSGSGSAGTNL